MNMNETQTQIVKVLESKFNDQSIVQGTKKRNEEYLELSRKIIHEFRDYMPKNDDISDIDIIKKFIPTTKAEQFLINFGVNRIENYHFMSFDKPKLIYELRLVIVDEKRDFPQIESEIFLSERECIKEFRDIKQFIDENYFKTLKSSFKENNVEYTSFDDDKNGQFLAIEVRNTINRLRLEVIQKDVNVKRVLNDYDISKTEISDSIKETEIVKTNNEYMGKKNYINRGKIKFDTDICFIPSNVCSDNSDEITMDKASYNGGVRYIDLITEVIDLLKTKYQVNADYDILKAFSDNHILNCLANHNGDSVKEIFLENGRDKDWLYHEYKAFIIGVIAPSKQVDAEKFLSPTFSDLNDKVYTQNSTKGYIGRSWFDENEIAYIPSSEFTEENGFKITHEEALKRGWQTIKQIKDFIEDAFYEYCAEYSFCIYKEQFLKDYTKNIICSLDEYGIVAYDSFDDIEDSFYLWAKDNYHIEYEIRLSENIYYINDDEMNNYAVCVCEPNDLNSRLEDVKKSMIHTLIRKAIIKTESDAIIKEHRGFIMITAKQGNKMNKIEIIANTRIKM